MQDFYVFAAAIAAIILFMHVEVCYFATHTLGRLISITVILVAARQHLAAGIAVAALWVLACHPKIRQSLHDALEREDPFVELVEQRRAWH